MACLEDACMGCREAVSGGTCRFSEIPRITENEAHPLLCSSGMKLLSVGAPRRLVQDRSRRYFALPAPDFYVLKEFPLPHCLNELRTTKLFFESHPLAQYNHRVPSSNQLYRVTPTFLFLMLP